MCEALNLNHDVLVKCIHKGITVKNLHRFLKKNFTIAAEDRGTNDIFVPAGITIYYAWNSAPIDDSDILRSSPAIGQEFYFPIDINLNVLPKLTQNNGQTILNC